MIKNGPLQSYEIGQLAYHGYSLVREILGESSPNFAELTARTQQAWSLIFTAFLTQPKRHEGRSYQDVARVLYEGLAQEGGLIGEVPPFKDAEPVERVAIEAAIRHLVSCHQADDGDNLLTLSTEFFTEWAPKRVRQFA